MRTRIFVLLFFLFGGTLFAQNGDRFGMSGAERNENVTLMDFAKDASGWQIERNTARMNVQNKTLIIEAIGKEPMFYREYDVLCDRIKVRLRLRTRANSTLVLYWITKESPRRGEDKSASIPLLADNEWHDYELDLPVAGHLLNISGKFTASLGSWFIESIESREQASSSIGVEALRQEGTAYIFTVANIGDRESTFDSISGTETKPHELAPGAKVEVAVEPRVSGNLAEVRLGLRPRGGQTTHYSIFKYVHEGTTEWIRIPFGTENDPLLFELDPNARMARIAKEGEVLAIIAPIVHRDGLPPEFKRNESENGSLRFDSTDVSLDIRFEKDTVRFLIEDLKKGTENPKNDVLEGPVVRAFGRLKSGLLSGVEYLGPGDVSSSMIDIEPPYNTRYAPPPEWITMPLSSISSDKISIGMNWSDMTLQPCMASPNFVDQSDDHRISLKGKKIDTKIRFTSEGAVTDFILWHIKEKGLPEPPKAPRTKINQHELTLRALRGAVQGEDKNTWSYGAESHWPRAPYADVQSVLWRLTGVVPRTGSITPGGTVITNDAIYFVTDRVHEWTELRDRSVQKVIDDMQPDGSFFYRTKFLQQEPETKIAPGYSARQVVELLEYVRVTGDRRTFSFAEKALQKLSEFNVPRGGHYWETPLHTPDLLASAYLTWAFTRAYELSGKEEYLREAKMWALSGLPFVYQWSREDRPVMLYTSVPMYGASERTGTPWFGTPQPWTGIVYAYSLNMLAPYEKEVPWKKIATGILHSIEQMQELNGPNAGCFPESYSISMQQNQSYRLNPAALASLRLAIEGEPEGLFIVHDASDRVASPFRARLSPEGAMIDPAPSGLRYQILRNGHETIQVQGSGARTLIPLK